ncbi:MAG: hypothetical protein KDD58_08465 [Bdellovibrionales bacterium]|nr:hypothetical protein [Bdellovibrionales bacterium]
MMIEKLHDFPMSHEDLQKIYSEDPCGLIHLILKLDIFLNKNGDEDLLLRKINFLTYELKSFCNGLHEQDKIIILNEYFFGANNFYSLAESSCLSEDLSLNQLFTSKKGNCLLLAIVYQYFANQIDLAIYAIGLQPIHIMKWYSNKKCFYIDLNRQGKIFKHDEILKIINCYNKGQDSFDALNNEQLFNTYLDELISALERNGSHEQLLTCLSLALFINENDLKALKNRGLLYYKNGYYNEALMDLKKYFSFTDFACTPQEIKTVYQKLIEIKKTEELITPISEHLH